MKISMISDEHFPFRGADTEVIVNTAAALGAQGAKVYLLTPHLWHQKKSTSEICAYYGVTESFEHLPIFNPFPPERKLRLQSFIHGFNCLGSRVYWQSDVVHTRDFIPLGLNHLLRRPWSFETYRRHAQEKPWIKPFTQSLNLKRAIGAIAHSEQSMHDLVSLGFDPSQVIVARPGFNQTAFEKALLPKDQARAILGLDQKAKIAGYIGNIGAGKGVDSCIQALKPLKSKGILGLIVGGSDQEVGQLKQSFQIADQDPNLILTGHQPSAKIPLYLSACDVLLIPPLERNSRGWLLDRILPTVLPGTPLKIYSYWASQRVIVAADQIHSTELLKHKQTAYLYDPNQIEQFSQTIQDAFDQTTLSEQIVANAYQQVMHMTYEQRAKQILAFYERRLSCR
jgi:glycosyltransferase involved in cell wall biosynthesis